MESGRHWLWFGTTVFALWASVGAGAFAQEPKAQEPPKATGNATRADLGPARELVKEQKYDEADRLLAELEKDHPDDGALLLLRGEVLLASGHPDQAAEPLRHAAEVTPEKLRVHFALGSALSAMGENALAVEAFGKEIELNPDPQVKILSRLNRSILLQKDKKWDEAAAELEKVIETEPGRKEAYGDLAELYLDAGRIDDASRTVERGLEAGLHSSRIYYRIAVAYYNQKSYDLAVGAFQKAIEIQPDLAQAELNLARSFEKLGRKEEADAHFRRYLELEPTAPEAAEIRKRFNPSPQAKAKAKTH